MFRIDLQTPLFSDPAHIPEDERMLLRLLKIYIDLDYLWWQRHPETPPLYQSGVRYIPEGGIEVWRTIPLVLSFGGGDCEDLVAYRISELRYTRQDVRARPQLVMFARSCSVGEAAPCALYHVRILRGDDSVEDPSARLGMPVGNVRGEVRYA